MTTTSPTSPAAVVVVLILLASERASTAAAGDFGCAATPPNAADVQPPAPLGGGCSSGVQAQQRREKRDIVFPGVSGGEFDTAEPLMDSYGLTQEQMDRLDEAETLDEISMIMNEEPEVGPVVFRSKLGNQPPGQAKSSAEKAVSAICRPMLQPVSIANVVVPKNHILHLPRCILIERCGGCCNNSPKSCQPTKTTKVLIEVNRYLVTQKGSVHNGTDLLPFERHVACRCLCKVKSEDCNYLQSYNPNQCKCECPNVDEEQKCRNDARKCWDKQECSCRCKNPPEPCTTGNSYDVNTCQCKSRRRHPLIPLSLRRKEDAGGTSVLFP